MESSKAPSHLTVVENPLITHCLSTMRREYTPDHEFRQSLCAIAPFLYAEALRGIRMKTQVWDTPVEKVVKMQTIGEPILLISILRAGDGLLWPIRELVPEAIVGHIGLVRDPVSFEPHCYLEKLPKDTKDRYTVVCDPMLATGNSARAAIDRVKAAGATRIRFVCLVAAPEGIKKMLNFHPDVSIITAAVDRKLNDHGYILPGLGDAGDRIAGTK